MGDFIVSLFKFYAHFKQEKLEVAFFSSLPRVRRALVGYQRLMSR